ncbi:TorF family putative porin [Planctobacterium marinum]|uniref:Exported protein n=1 Tax=Planctobacterium marinum TaxID=1631968 RepID=A0AA48KW58_9ALTE|nr:exported protein [Planctobacterium marinum]
MKLTKTSAAIAFAVAACTFSQASYAEVSANVGLVSEYHFRGIQQTSSASASAGLDYEEGGFYLGTWVADVEDGLEIDFYGGYGFDISEDVSASIGVTTYQYTGDFDSAYNELNLGLGWGMLSIEYTIGEWDDDADLGIPGGDYTFLGLTLEHEGFYGTFGTFGDEADGEYFEVGYGTEIGGFDAGISMVFADSDLGGGESDETILFSIGKSFSL